MMNSIKINYVALGVTVTVALLIVGHVYFNRPKAVVEGSINLKELLSVSIELAERGGEQTAQVKADHLKLHAESKGLTKEGKAELKTDGDMQSHRVIIAGFHKTFPGLFSRIVSEEHDKQKEMTDVKPAEKLRSEVSALPDEVVDLKDVTVWIDPLDATQEYTENLDNFVTVMVCVAVKGKPVIGVINRPMDSEEYKKETVWAWVNKGVSENMQAVKDTKTTDQPKIIISRSHAGAAKDVVEKAFGKNEAAGDKEDDRVRPAGGAGYKALEVIRGKADIYAHTTLIKKWDICAGDAMLRAVGGAMKTLKDEEINYDISTPAANEHGLLAAMNGNLDYYMKKLAPIFANQP